MSALTGDGLDRLLSLIDAALPFDTVRTERFQIPLAAGADIALLHSSARVIRENYNELSVEIEAEVPESIRSKLARYVVAESITQVAPTYVWNHEELWKTLWRNPAELG